MSKPRSRLADYAVYLAVRAFVCFVQMLSIRAAYTLSGGLAWLAHRADRRHRLVALENLEASFGDAYTAGDRSRLIRATYEHFCQLLIEIILLPRKLHLNNWSQYVHIRESPALVEFLLSGRPLLLVTAHFGNWEMGGYVLGLLGFPTHAVARPLDNPYLDEFLRRFRERTGQRLLAKKGDFDQMQKILLNGGVIATLGDQDAGQRGLFVDFFGRPASTHKAIALLSLQYQAPLLVMLPHNTGKPMHYEAGIEEAILPEHFASDPDAVREITQRFSAAVEKKVRAHPAQYFWLHRRWKHQPPRSRRKVA
jgi:Kdo2-lipid IVA lauroyltransferase/acyltransferase